SDLCNFSQSVNLSLTNILKEKIVTCRNCHYYKKCENILNVAVSFYSDEICIDNLTVTTAKEFYNKKVYANRDEICKYQEQNGNHETALTNKDFNSFENYRTLQIKRAAFGITFQNL